MGPCLGATECGTDSDRNDVNKIVAFLTVDPWVSKGFKMFLDG